MIHDMTDTTITLAITGASGAIYGLRLLEQLLIAKQTVYLMISTPAHIVIELETGLKLPADPNQIQTILTDWFQITAGQLRLFGLEEWTSPVASGSAVSKAMVICPCSMGTLAAIATGLNRSLIERAADVILKEQRKLIVVPRESPFSTIHLENMLRLSKLGTVILPASPGFYHNPKNINELVDFIVARILDHLAIKHTLLPRWGLQFDE